MNTMSKPDHSAVWKQADDNCRTIVGTLEHRVYVKLMRYNTAALVRLMESGKENLDDETLELTSRLEAIGYCWHWGTQPGPELIEPLPIERAEQLSGRGAP